MLRGWARAAHGNFAEGLSELREALAAWRATGSKFHTSYRLMRAADACRMAGLVDEGLALVGEAFEASEENNERWFLAEQHRLRGELLQLAGDCVEAETEYQVALEAARGQGARLWQLRASTSLARLWCEAGKRTEARDLLAPIYGWFTEAFDTPDLKEANALLTALVPS